MPAILLSLFRFLRSSWAVTGLWRSRVPLSASNLRLSSETVSDRYSSRLSIGCSGSHSADCGPAGAGRCFMSRRIRPPAGNANVPGEQLTSLPPPL
jgi:hypothetical protein